MAEFISELNLELFSGLFGTRPVTILKDGKGELSEAKQAAAWEKPFEGCELVNNC